jgi:hypothetical protein
MALCCAGSKLEKADRRDRFCSYEKPSGKGFTTLMGGRSGALPHRSSYPPWRSREWPRLQSSTRHDCQPWLTQGEQDCFFARNGMPKQSCPAPVGSAITPPTTPRIAVPPIAVAVPIASARIEAANHKWPRNSHGRPRNSHDRPRNSHDRSTIGTTVAIRPTMESDATSLGGFCGRGRT